MKILGIDFGLRNIGLAISIDGLIEPYGQIKFRKFPQALLEIKNILAKERPDRLVLGIAEGKMAQKSKQFADQLKNQLDIPVFLQDESFTSAEARERMLEIGKPYRKRQQQEHQIAACLLLENFLARMNNERRP